MTQNDTRLQELCELAGVATRYTDVYGKDVETPVETRRAVLAAFGYPADSDGAVADSLVRIRRTTRGPIDPLIVADAGRPTALTVRPGAGTRALSFVLTDELGRAREERAPVRQLDGRAVVDLPRLSPGYYRLTLSGLGEPASATVIAAPRRCFLAPDLEQDEERVWGISAQLYGLVSDRNFGIGSYRDVATLAQRTAELGGAFVGLSPAHALFSADRSKVSPYSPSSRLFLETLHIDPAFIPNVTRSPAWQMISAARPEIERLRATNLVEHGAVWSVLQPILAAAFEQHDWLRDADVAAFRRAGGDALEAHATFEALSSHFVAEGRHWVGAWPEEMRRWGTAEVRSFREAHAREVDFHVFLQWLADRQLADASRHARRAGMPIGLYRDLAVGADRAGSEVWQAPERFGQSLSIGAPPDLLGPQGQDWGLPPLDPLALAADGLAAFRSLVAANMRHAGAVRIDHAFQLQRLFVMPLGEPASRGTYIEYPFEAMLAVLRVESHRARCMVIAEDLGTAPPGFSDAIIKTGVLSYRVLAFERDQTGFKPPSAYPREALAVTGTHDLATFVGWWHGVDTDLREALGVYPREKAETERAERVTEKQQLLEAFAREGLEAEASPETPPYDAMLRFLARSPALLQGVQLEDVLAERSQANVPGTVNEHPNWRRKLKTDIDTLTRPGGPLARTAAVLASEGRGGRPLGAALAAPPPRATYRIQFHAGFTFDDAAAIVPYLAKLGISHLYASPIQKARPGSMHGYDVVDHALINPELGGADGFDRLHRALSGHGMGLVLDIVPNHMAVGGSDNPWWLSLLEWGELSPWARAFDVDWQRLGADGKVVLPFLGDRYGDALEKGDLELRFDAAEGSFSVHHYEHRFPISPLTYPLVLDRALAALETIDAGPAATVLEISERLRRMAGDTAPERRAAFVEEGEAMKRALAEAAASETTLSAAIGRALALINGIPGRAESFGTLHRILEQQSYRPAHWRVAASDINYRRFFDINSLAGLRVEDEVVFAHTHALIFDLVRRGKVQGLRIDHVDGLADPSGYLAALQREVGPGFYVVVEKILEPGEKLRAWPVAGTTGYDALAAIDGLFVDERAAPAFDALYRRIVGRRGKPGAEKRAVKSEVLELSFASELEVLVSDAKRIADPDRRTRDFTTLALRRALIEIIARWPVYRSYLGEGAIAQSDLDLVESTIAAAKRGSVLPDRSVHDFIGDILLGAIETDGPGRPPAELPRRFRRRFQQLTGPVMAKSIEDTLFYRDVRLIALNEVGADPHHFGMAPDAFHALFREHARDWPHAMIASSTHDTKRGEDARGRLLALSEMPDELSERFERFEAACRPFVETVDDDETPGPDERYFILQTLLGSWPDRLLDEPSDAGFTEWRTRLVEYLRKATREAKRRTSWVSINEPYEAALQRFLERVVAPGAALEDLRAFAQRLAALGRLNGLSRAVLKCTLPGVPDIYQGSEFWDLSLVDPDNRRPVDFSARRVSLEGRPDWGALLTDIADGRLKQRVIARLLADRAERPAFYAGAGYAALAPSGRAADRLFAFERTLGEERLLVLVPRLLAGPGDETMTGGHGFFAATTIAAQPGPWRDVVTGADVKCEGGAFDVAALFRELPFAVLRSE